MAQPPQSPTPSYASQPEHIAIPRRRIPCITPLIGCILGLILLAGCLAGIPLLCIFSIALDSPEAIDSNFSPNSTQAQEYEETFANGVQTASLNNGTFTIGFSDEQFASWLTVEFDRIRQDYNFDPANEEFRHRLNQCEFQANFSEERLQLYTAIALDFDVEMGIFIEATITPNTNTRDINNRLDVNVRKFRIGAVDMPKNLREMVGDLIADILLEKLEFNQAYQITSLTIADGRMQIIGQLIQ
jgi:hypothetical protein